MAREARQAADAALARPATGTVRRSALSTDLAAAIAQMISTDQLSAGQPIPAVRPLAQRFGVAVPTMREALRQLEGMGILEFRHGSGIYVGPNSTRLVMANVLAPRPTREKLEQLLQARLVIEPPIAALAATVRPADGIARLEQALTQAHRCLLADDPELAVANSDLHRMVAVATGNAVLAETLESLAAVHADDQAEILVLHGDAEQDYAEHADIVGHITAGDAEAARRSMHEHLAGVLEVVSARRAEQSPGTSTSTTARS